MAVSENRRRKKLESHRAKRKEQKRSIARFESSGNQSRMTIAQSWPVVSACVSSTLWSQGIGYAAIGRRGPQGQVAGTIFLLDVFCLGVKDVVFFANAEWQWHELLSRFEKRDQGFGQVSPEFVRKLVEGAVAYAKSFGLEPHRDWADASRIFGEIDASKCPSEFTYGKDGKPLFIAGPNDTPTKAQRIIQTLSNSAGQGNFDFIAPIAAEDLPNGHIHFEDSLEMEPTCHVHSSPHHDCGCAH